MKCPYCGSLETQVKDSRPTEDCDVDPPPPRLSRLRRPLHDLRAGATARTDGGQEVRPPGAVRPRQAACARSSRCASGRSSRSASSAWSTASCASSRACGENEVPSERDRRARHGGPEGPRRRRLCPLRLGLPQFPRGQGFRGGVGRAFRRPAKIGAASKDTRSGEAPEMAEEGSSMRPAGWGRRGLFDRLETDRRYYASGTGDRSPRPRQGLAEPGRRLRDRPQRGRRSRLSSVGVHAAGRDAPTPRPKRWRQAGPLWRAARRPM